MYKAKKIKLSNGLQVVLVEMPGSPTTTVEVLVKTGSKYESDKQRGLSHVLEHMCFKGTTTYPTAEAVSRAFDELGAISNAFTSNETTGYWAKVESKQVLKVVPILADIYQNTIFKKEDLEKEKGVIIEEINMYEDRPQDIVGEVFDHTIHGDQPAGRPIIGTKDSVRSFTIKDLYDYRREHYVAKATMIVVAGHFSQKEVTTVIKKSFKNISRGPKKGKKKTKIKHRGPVVALKHKETDQVHLILGLRSFPYRDKRNRILGVIRNLLSGGMSSRLFQKLRVELGICYYVGALSAPSTDHGEFGVAAGVDVKRVDVAVEAIMGELKKLTESLISEEELIKVKTLMISRIYMGLETSDSVLDYFSSRATFYEDLKLPQEIEKEILAVTREQVRALAKTIFKEQDLTLALVGRGLNQVKLKKLLSFK